jgi:hypothetical protein
MESHGGMISTGENSWFCGNIISKAGELEREMVNLAYEVSLLILRKVL